MKHLLVSLMAMLTLVSPAQAKSFDIGGYQDEKGAITVHYAADAVDPYFATKALLLAHEAGLDIEKSGKAWIGWLLPRQLPHGLFERYCRQRPEEWKSCAATDADDVMQALWMALLYTMAPKEGMPESWQKSLRTAQSQLASLYDSKLGVYQVSSTQPAHLLMDNVEIYAALRVIAREQKRLGLTDDAALTERQTIRLSEAINRVFRQSKDTAAFRVSTQPRMKREFYPDTVAQIFPWLHDMPMWDREREKSAYHEWIKNYRTTWLHGRNEDYPWGLVAVAALKRGDAVSAYCWQAVAAPLRYGKRWNVLEEAAFQNIAWRMHSRPALPPSTNCG